MWQPIFCKIIPKKVRNIKHWFYAYFGACKYRNPSEQMFVIGVTGTSGKSTTVFFLRQLLEQAGYAVGSLSTIDFYIAGQDKLNDQKMTMLGKAQTQKYLREMADAGCDIAIIEITSEGFVQHRHKYINFDVIVLTNLYPEHIESHGSFNKYKKAKLGIFKYISKCKEKYRLEKYQKVVICDLVDNPKAVCQKAPKIAVINANSQYAPDFLQFKFSNKFLFGRHDQKNYFEKNDLDKYTSAVIGKSIEVDNGDLRFIVDKHQYCAPIYGEHNIMNILAGIAVARGLKIKEEIIMQAVAGLVSPPGRMEFIKEADKCGFQVIVDYAFEVVALEKLYAAVELIKPKRIIHLFGNTGGGRDKPDKKAELVGEKADIVIITNEDPYDDDPRKLIKQVSVGVEKAGKKPGKDLFEILDRKEAIAKAIELAQTGDLVLITGKGSEQKLCVSGGRMIDWDDREAAREALQRLK
ncbi:MAG: UDP-N-acetylmuramyl-tripeptide synthetase [Patescibacteria group bacterium]